MRILSASDVSELRAAAQFYAAKSKASSSRFGTDEYREMIADMQVGDCVDIFEDMTPDEQAAVKAIVAAKGIVSDKDTLKSYRATLNAAKADLRGAIRDVLGASANVQTTVDDSGNVYGALIDEEGNFGFLVRRTA